MPTKAPVKKTKKAPRKPVKKQVKKITQADIEANFTRMQKSQDEAWVAIKETQQAHKETEKAIKESNLRMEKSIKETQQAVKETQKNVGGLNNTLGSMVEHILTPGLPQKFKKFGYSFTRIASYSYAAGVWAQIDGMLENGTQAMAVEVKMTLRQIDIDDHIDRMEKIRKYADEHGDNRKFIGAIAAIITDEATKNYALKNGLFLIEPSGEDVKVTKPETEPRVW
jgi:hypothetical protein